MTNKKKRFTQQDLIMEFFKNNPDRDIFHPEVVDWASSEWRKRTGEVFRDPDRSIRKLYQSGYLKKIKKGVYHYDPDGVEERQLEDFSAADKARILERDDYCCAECGLGRKDGVELHIDHIIPKDLGGKAVIENGQVLCSRHNMLKKNYNQTQSGKRMFIRLYKLAKKNKNKEIQLFCVDVLRVYENHDMNGHIKWEE